MKPSVLTAIAVAVLLSGCQLSPRSQSAAPAAPDPALVRVVAQQQVLWQEGVINTPSALPADAIVANTDQLSVNWSGDAVELLSYLAKQRGARFNWTGVRLPLPVNVHARGVTYQNLLEMIEMQTAWRAELHQLPGQLTLAFMPAQLKEQAGARP